MSTILIGVDDTERSQDAIAFGSQIANATGATVIVANAYPYSDVPRRAADDTYRRALAEDAKKFAHEMRDRLEGVPDERALIRVMANPSPAHALHDLAHAERAALIIVGSTHTGHVGRVLPGSTGERLFHGAPCSVAVVPKDYRKQGHGPIRRIGVAYNGSDEAAAAAQAAAELARAFGAELDVIGVVDPLSYSTPALMSGASEVTISREIERHVQEGLDEMVASLPSDITSRSVRLTGPPAEMLAEYSSKLDLLIMGSRGYGPLRSVLVGGVSGRVVRSAHCPVIVVPRGIEAPLTSLFDDAASTVA
ncbi:MAG TPA: universal stress protein [Solirubrobacter sp.]|nr:universal stress protein [Solirubrobacter sp.]